jgi:hypothetical protein
MTRATPQRFSDYVVYVDESGDHGLKSMEKTYSILVLDQFLRPAVQQFGCTFERPEEI